MSSGGVEMKFSVHCQRHGRRCNIPQRYTDGSPTYVSLSRHWLSHTHTRTHRRMSANAFSRCVIAWVRVFVLAEQCMTFDWMYACGDSFYVLLRHIWQNIHTYVIKAARRPWQNAHRLCHRLRTAAKPVKVDFVYRQTAALLTEALINYGWVCWAPAKR